MRDLPHDMLLYLSAPEPGAAPSGRVLVVGAHPDDEVIGLGSRLPRLRGAAFVCLTDGAPRDGLDAAANGFAGTGDYARARRREQLAALAIAGIPPEAVHCLGCPDQQTSLRLVGLTRRVAELIRDTAPEMVVTHPYEGGHPDHDATAFVVHAACSLVGLGGTPPPSILEMTSYHASPEGIEVGAFLQTPEPTDSAEAWLSGPERCLRVRMLARFATQRRVLAPFMEVRCERFRRAPAYDFTSPAHAGQLFYERHPWGMTGERFGSLAREALAQLGLAESACA